MDYSLIRTPITELDEIEMKYCENDILVLFYYIKYELETYEDVKHIPNTSTGHVRRELKEKIDLNFKYKRIVKNAINTDSHIFNLLQQAFMGGYTHSSYVFTSVVLQNIDSYDECSAYPYVLVTHKFPMSKFRRCNIKRRDQMSNRLAYLLVVRFKNIKCKYLNHFISGSKCREIRGAKYDNGRIYEATELVMTLTDVDFHFILDTHKCTYTIEECYFAKYGFLPIEYINFILDKYENKTKYKDDDTKKLQYQKEKNKFNRNIWNDGYKYNQGQC